MNAKLAIFTTIVTIALLGLSGCDSDNKKEEDSSAATELNSGELEFMETDYAIDQYYLDTAITVPYVYQKQNPELPDKYVVEKTAAIDTQGGNECSACSSSYLLRFYGFEADYQEIYKNIECKQSDGSVYPKGVDKLFDTYEGLDAVFYHGTIEDLEDAVSMGLPQIVLIKISTDNDSLHYVTVVGYDEENIYLQDSYSGYRNEESTQYNRSISKTDFDTIWGTGIDCCDHIFISVVSK